MQFRFTNICYVFVCVCVLFLFVCKVYTVLAGITAASKPPIAPGNGSVSITADLLPAEDTGIINMIRGGCSNFFKYLQVNVLYKCPFACNNGYRTI